MLDDLTGIRQRDVRGGEQGKRKVGRAGQTPWTLSVPTWSPLLQPSAPPHRALSSHGPAPRCSAHPALPCRWSHSAIHPHPRPPAINLSKQPSLCWAPSPQVMMVAPWERRAPILSQVRGGMGRQRGRKMGKNCSELTQQSTWSGEEPGRHLLHVVK